ncbi:unnamed protein product [Clavelina lepadiformis]|uniref:MYM-type domain-containing protein n=1 Tax=Clavelina lepadiformis TaxID=159417 RepID=A0ABP0FCT3_CLALP
MEKKMIERVESSGETTYFCSLDCLNNFRVKESRLIAMTKCETCEVTGTMTYFSHKSDKTVKGFCSSKCVKQYQGCMKQQTTEVTTSFTNNQSKGDFIISDVRSIAHGERSNIVPTDLVTPSFTTVTDSSGKRFVLVNKNCSMPKGSLNVPREIIRANRTDSKLTKSLADCSNGIKFKNKSIMCKPYQHDKASQVECSCKTVDAQTQTDKSRDVCLLPVPVYVPCPVKMYTDYAPVPFPIPIPVAVPVFIPTLLNNVNDILNTIEEIKASVPTNPLEADLIMMAEAVAQTERMKNVDFEMNLTQEVVSESDACSNSVIPSNTEKDQLTANCDVLVANDDVEMGTAYDIPDRLIVH